MDISSSPPATYRSSSVQPGPVSLVIGGIREAVSRRRLVRYLVQADLKKKGSDTVLGNVWWVLDPLLQMMVYVVLVTVIFARSQPDYPLFIFASILPWKWFTASVSDAIASVVSQERLIKQLQFPKIVLPLAATFAGIVNFLFGMIPLAGLLLLMFRDRISPLILLIPVVAIVQLTFTTAIALIVSALNVFVRDVGNIARHVLRLWFYLSPGLYAMQQLEGSSIVKDAPILGRIFKLNPFAVLFESYRSIIYGTATSKPQLPDFGALGVLFAVSLVLVVVAIAFFKRLEPQFAKVL